MPLLTPQRIRRHRRRTGLWLWLVLPAMLVVQMLLAQHGVMHTPGLAHTAHGSLAHVHAAPGLAVGDASISPCGAQHAHAKADAPGHQAGDTVCQWLDNALGSHVPVAAACPTVAALNLAQHVVLQPRLQPLQAEARWAYAARGPPARLA